MSIEAAAHYTIRCDTCGKQMGGHDVHDDVVDVLIFDSRQEAVDHLCDWEMDDTTGKIECEDCWEKREAATKKIDEDCMEEARKIIVGWNAGASPEQGTIKDIDNFATWIARALRDRSKK